MFTPFRHSCPRRAFTLTELLVALAALTILAALLFPALSQARESSRQSHCAGNLSNIYLATRQYREDYQGYPANLEVLLPAGSKVVATSGTGEPLAGEPGIPEAEGGGTIAPPKDSGDGASTPRKERVPTVDISVPNGALSYLKSTDEALCSSDTVELNGFSSSYGNKIGSVWNFYGYDRLGFSTQTAPGRQLLVNPNQDYDAQSNPAKYSLANRFAPAGTIVTHCIFHRTATSGLRNPYALSTQAARGSDGGAKDLILRLDGSAKIHDVSGFIGTRDEDTGAYSAQSNWQIQTF